MLQKGPLLVVMEEGEVEGSLVLSVQASSLEAFLGSQTDPGVLVWAASSSLQGLVLVLAGSLSLQWLVLLLAWS